MLGAVYKMVQLCYAVLYDAMLCGAVLCYVTYVCLCVYDGETTAQSFCKCRNALHSFEHICNIHSVHIYVLYSHENISVISRIVSLQTLPEVSVFAVKKLASVNKLFVFQINFLFTCI